MAHCERANEWEIWNESLERKNIKDDENIIYLEIFCNNFAVILRRLLWVASSHLLNLHSVSPEGFRIKPYYNSYDSILWKKLFQLWYYFKRMNQALEKASFQWTKKKQNRNLRGRWKEIVRLTVKESDVYQNAKHYIGKRTHLKCYRFSLIFFMDGLLWLMYMHES